MLVGLPLKAICWEMVGFHPYLVGPWENAQLDWMDQGPIQQGAHVIQMLRCLNCRFHTCLAGHCSEIAWLTLSARGPFLPWLWTTKFIGKCSLKVPLSLILFRWKSTERTGCSYTHRRSFSRHIFYFYFIFCFSTLTLRCMVGWFHAWIDWLFTLKGTL